MDKDILRIIILIIGAVVALSIYVWGRVKKRGAKRRTGPRNQSRFDEFEPLDINPAEELSEEFDLEGIGTTVDELDFANGPRLFPEEESDDEGRETPESELPSLIQLAIVARTREGFKGPLLVKTLERLGLEYGAMEIYHRYDAVTGNRLYSVANMVEPGIFPKKNLDTLRCPGLLFFIQPRELAYPLEAFEDLIQTFHKISAALDGEEWDRQRKPLTVQTIEELRASLYPSAR